MRTAYLDELNYKDSSINRTPPNQFRLKCRTQEFTSQSSGSCPGFVQANVTILPREYAYDFLVFCQRNPKPCPLLEILDPGSYLTSVMANNADIRTDIPKYTVLRNGQRSEELHDISSLWHEDLVTFLLGCSYSFEEALIREGIPVRHIQENKNVPMYVTSIPCRPAGIFSGPLVVSMRPVHKDLVAKAVEITSKFPRVHGAPVHVGNAEEIGIKDINRVDFGEAVTIREDEVPVFWACGVTPMKACMDSRIPFAITHSPGHMLVLDKLNIELEISNEISSIE